MMHLVWSAGSIADPPGPAATAHAVACGVCLVASEVLLDPPLEDLVEMALREIVLILDDLHLLARRHIQLADVQLVQYHPASHVISAHHHCVMRGRLSMGLQLYSSHEAGEGKGVEGVKGD